MIDLIGYGAFFLTTALIFSLISLGLNLQWGLTGLFNVGVAGFVAIGAYVSALLTTPHDAARFGGFELSILAGWLGAMLVAGVAAAITLIPRPFAALAETPLLFNLSNVAIVAAVTLVAYLALQHLSKSPWGRVLKALREDERAAISLGKSARFYRV